MAIHGVLANVDRLSAYEPQVGPPATGVPGAQPAARPSGGRCMAAAGTVRRPDRQPRRATGHGRGRLADPGTTAYLTAGRRPGRSAAPGPGGRDVRHRTAAGGYGGGHTAQPDPRHLVGRGRRGRRVAAGRRVAGRVSRQTAAGPAGCGDRRFRGSRRSATGRTRLHGAAAARPASGLSAAGSAGVCGALQPPAVRGKPFRIRAARARLPASGAPPRTTSVNAANTCHWAALVNGYADGLARGVRGHPCCTNT